MGHYELYSWSHQYSQERLAEASTIQLEAKLRASRSERGRRDPLSVLRNAIASLQASSESNDSLPAESIR